MKKFFTIFFVSLGVIFFCIILALVYLWIVDPYNIKPFIYQTNNTQIENNEEIGNTGTSSSATDQDDTAEDTTNPGGGITEEQKKALQSVGIDPTVLPKSFTPEQEQCFVGEFGQVRVDEIKAGAVPTPFEVLAGKHCL